MLELFLNWLGLLNSGLAPENSGDFSSLTWFVLMLFCMLYIVISRVTVKNRNEELTVSSIHLVAMVGFFICIVYSVEYKSIYNFFVVSHVLLGCLPMVGVNIVKLLLSKMKEILHLLHMSVLYSIGIRK